MKTLIILISMVALTAHAESITIAGGGGQKQGSVYSSVLATLSATCSTDDTQLKEVNTNGGVKNLELLRGGQVKGGVVPTDLLYATKLENPASVANLKVLIPLHDETVHLVAREQKVVGGVTAFGRNFGGETTTFKSIEDLKGRPVGAVGGSVVTARILNELLRVGFQVTQFETNTDLMNSLEKGDVDAALIVAGSPSPVVSALTRGKFRLLPVRGNSDTDKVYSSSRTQYENLGGGRAVDTLNTRALLVMRQFRTPEILDSLSQLRSCFNKNLTKIQDSDGSHPVWQDMSATAEAKWPMYDLPQSKKR